MAAIKTVYTYNLDGTKKDFNIPFEYLARKFVRVTLIGKDRKILTLNTDYRFSTKTQITTTKAWGEADGYRLLEIRRYTSATERLVDYTDGSILRAYDLNLSQLQTIHVAEEARDLTADTIGVNNTGDLDARGRRIVNLGNAVSDNDAVPYGQLKAMNNSAFNSMTTAGQYKDQAKGFRDEAEVSRNAAEAAKARAGASELKAKDWAIKTGSAVEGNEFSAKHHANQANASQAAAAASATASRNAQTAAETAQRHAANSQAAAAISQEGAKKEADRAKVEADKLGNMNAFAGALEGVRGLSVGFRERVAARNFTIRMDEDPTTGAVKAYDQSTMEQVKGSKEFLSQRYISAQGKRNDIYQYHANDPDTWPSGRSEGNGTHIFKGGVAVSKDVVATGQFMGSSANNFRISYGGVGTFWRNDSQNLYLMMTDKGNPTGNYNNFRPFAVNLTNGRVTMANGITSDLVQHNGQYRNNSTPSAGGLANQLNGDAAFSQVLPGNQDGNVYYPMVKQFGRRTDGYPTAMSLGMVSRGQKGFHTGWLQLIGDNNNVAGWQFNMDGKFGTHGINSTAQITAVQNGPALFMSTQGNAENQSVYLLAQAGGNNWYIGKGGAGNEITLHSYKLNTNIVMRAGTIDFNKPIKVGPAQIQTDGNIVGTAWGGNLHDWCTRYFKRKTGGWTKVMDGATGHGVVKQLSQDVRFRQCWFTINGHLMPVFIGGDGTYYTAGWGNGWIKFQISNNGRTFKNIEDSVTVPTAIWVENA